MHHAVRSLQRAMQIAKMTTKRGRMPARIGVVFDAVYQSACERKDVAAFIAHQSVIKTTFLLYFATPAGISSTCDATGAVSIIGRWKPLV